MAGMVVLLILGYLSLSSLLGFAHQLHHIFEQMFENVVN